MIIQTHQTPEVYTSSVTGGTCHKEDVLLFDGNRQKGNGRTVGLGQQSAVTGQRCYTHAVSCLGHVFKKMRRPPPHTHTPHACTGMTTTRMTGNTLLQCAFAGRRGAQRRLRRSCAAHAGAATETSWAQPRRTSLYTGVRDGNAARTSATRCFTCRACKPLCPRSATVAPTSCRCRE